MKKIFLILVIVLSTIALCIANRNTTPIDSETFAAASSSCISFSKTFQENGLWFVKITNSCDAPATAHYYYKSKSRNTLKWVQVKADIPVRSTQKWPAGYNGVMI